MDIKRLINYIKPYKSRFILSIGCMGIFSALTGGTMWLVKIYSIKYL
jgi:ABC-type multidrug transport system fused ATPase/permease subunit